MNPEISLKKSIKRRDLVTMLIDLAHQINERENIYKEDSAFVEDVISFKVSFEVDVENDEITMERTYKLAEPTHETKAS
jgi:hypothetical protein